MQVNAPEGCRHGTHTWDGLHTRHLLESTHTNTHKHTARPDKVRCGWCWGLNGIHKIFTTVEPNLVGEPGISEKHDGRGALGRRTCFQSGYCPQPTQTNITAGSSCLVRACCPLGVHPDATPSLNGAHLFVRRVQRHPREQGAEGGHRPPQQIQQQWDH